jgi:hypothetical protein
LVSRSGIPATVCPGEPTMGELCANAPHHDPRHCRRQGLPRSGADTANAAMAVTVRVENHQYAMLDERRSVVLGDWLAANEGVLFDRLVHWSAASARADGRRPAASDPGCHPAAREGSCRTSLPRLTANMCQGCRLFRTLDAGGKIGIGLGGGARGVAEPRNRARSRTRLASAGTPYPTATHSPPASDVRKSHHSAARFVASP